MEQPPAPIHAAESCETDSDQVHEAGALCRMCVNDVAIWLCLAGEKPARIHRTPLKPSEMVRLQIRTTYLHQQANLCKLP